MFRISGDKKNLSGFSKLFGFGLASILLISLLAGCSKSEQPPQSNAASQKTSNSAANAPSVGSNSLTSDSQSGGIPFPLKDKQAPDFKLATLDGKEISLKDLKGKPVVLNFFASWCPPCIIEMPDLNEFATEYKDQVHVIGLNVTTNDKIEDVKKVVNEKQLKFPIALDEKGEAALAYNIRPIPTTYFIDKDGVVRDIIIGAARSKADFAQRIDAIKPK